MHTDVKHRYSISARRMSRSIIRELLKLANKPGIISFAGGLPNPQTFPSADLKEICSTVLAESPEVTLQYSATEGLSSLRDLLVDFVARYGLRLGREELIVTTASQQSLDLVVVEQPGYLGAVSAFKSYGVRFLPVEMDGQGMKADVLHNRLREMKKEAGSGIEYYRNMPKFIYTIPDFQNPSGITMSLQRRKELLRLAEEFLRRGLAEGRIQANISLYRGKLRCMLDALEQFMPRMPGLSWIVPEGGMFLWNTLPEGMDADEMFKDALERNVAYVVGSAFHPGGGGHNTMRLNFSYCSDQDIREGIRRLAGLVSSRRRGAA